ncbi:MAG: hypothetical protein Q9177_000338 [Variospora cf. flavescens]
MHPSIILLSILPFVAPSAQFNLQKLFGPSLSPGAEIILRSDANWAQAVQQRWSTWEEPTYKGAIKVATVRDVQNVVKIASANNIQFLATAAGHGTSKTYSRVRHGIDIDLSNLRYVNLDATKNIITIGGATKFQQIWDVLQPAGKEISIFCRALRYGAGIGPLQGLHGLMLDSLVSVKLVTAKGDLITVSESHHQGLFWGIRGAGFNFGIVTEATFRVYDTTYSGQVLEGDLLFPASANRSIFQLVASFDETLPKELSLTTVLSYNPKTDKSSIILNIIYFGAKERAQPYIDPFLKLGPTKTNITMVPWNKLYAYLFFGGNSTACRKNQYLSSAGQGLRRTDPATFETFFGDMTNFLRQYKAIAGTFVATRFPNQAVLAVPDESTAYPYRDIKTHLLYQHIYPNNGTLDEAVDSFLVDARKKFTVTSGYDNLTMYNNYGHGDESAATLYSSRKLRRLIRLKREWDPKQQFSFNNPLPLHWP